jgi:glycerophosphoryl diester phosphodiesterase
MTAIHAPRDDAPPRVLAHRGFAGVAPENTVAAALAAARADADAVEVDAMPCAEGTPVVFHDDRLDGVGGSRGVTDGSGVVWETPGEAVRGADVLDSGETVPSLSELAAALPADVALNVELKRPGSPATWERQSGTRPDDPWNPFADAVLDALAGCANDVLFSSFSEAALAAVRDRAPDAPVAVLFADDPAAGLERARRLDAEAIHPALDLVVRRDGARVSALDPHGLVATAREEGRAVNAWTVATWYEADRLREAGVDGLIADYPGLSGE